MDNIETKKILDEANATIEDLTAKLSKKNDGKIKDEMVKEISLNVMKQLAPFIKTTSDLIAVIKDFEKNPQVITKKEMIEALKEVQFMPKFTIPDIKIPQINVPEIKIPEIKIPKIEMPKMVMPEIKMPTQTVRIDATDIKMPSIIFPKSVSTEEIQASQAIVTAVSGTRESVELVGVNPKRKGLYFYNNSDFTAYLKLGRDASSTSFTILLESKSYYELTRPVYTGVIEGRWERGDILITEIV